jgi:hypothetical protein
MKRQKSCGPRLGKLVHQLPGVVTFAYDLCFRRKIAHWKDISKDYNSCRKFCERNVPKKMSFRASKRLQKFRTRKTAKNSKIPKLPESCFEPAGKGGWPLISSWINPPSLGRNGLHCIDFSHQMRKFLLNLAPGEPLALVQELPCFDDSIKMDPFLLSALDLCVHNLITGFLLYAVGVELCWCQLFCYVLGVQ